MSQRDQDSGGGEREGERGRGERERGHMNLLLHSICSTPSVALHRHLFLRAFLTTVHIIHTCTRGYVTDTGIMLQLMLLEIDTLSF